MRILILSPDRIYYKLAGIGLRHYEIASALARRGFDVTLASVDFRVDAITDRFPVISLPSSRVPAFAKSFDVIFLQGNVLERNPRLGRLKKVFIIDLICPFLIEDFENYSAALSRETSIRKKLEIETVAFEIVHQMFWKKLIMGDYFICGSERQRDLWIGMLTALGRVNPHTYRQDPTFRRLIDVVQNGLPAEPPKHNKKALRGVVPGIHSDDIILFWGGGIWEWFDPLTPIRAMAEVVKKHKNVKMVFGGLEHPSLRGGMTAKAQMAIDLAKSLKLLDSCVFFNSGWIPYDERENYLMEADAGINAHHDILETHFAVRARIKDYYWARLPIITTRGDAESGVIREKEMGFVLDYEDVSGWTDAIISMLDPGSRREFAKRIEAHAKECTWDQVVEPLAKFCENPHVSPGKEIIGSNRFYRSIFSPSSGTGKKAAYYAYRSASVLRTEGITGFARKLRAYVRKTFGAGEEDSQGEKPPPNPAD
ncbi:MAG: glycosyltransferase family 4 protein [Planctomycetota bacterium]